MAECVKQCDRNSESSQGGTFEMFMYPNIFPVYHILSHPFPLLWRQLHLVRKPHGDEVPKSEEGRKKPKARVLDSSLRQINRRFATWNFLYTVKLVWIKWTWFLQVVFKVSVPEGLSACGSAAPHLVNIVTRFSFLGEFTEIVSGGSRWTRWLLFSSHFFRRSLSFSDFKWQVVWQNGLFFNQKSKYYSPVEQRIVVSSLFIFLWQNNNRALIIRGNYSDVIFILLLPEYDFFSYFSDLNLSFYWIIWTLWMWGKCIKAR